MIQVSNEFKRAIKESERRIKGYVEVLYDLPSVTVAPTTNMTSTYTNTSEISNGVRVENLYGSLDYLTLDGSYLAMGTTNTNIGFISDELFENLTTPTITLSFSSTTVKGVTLYFRNNTPINLTINYSDGTSDTVSNNEKDIIQVIFNNPKTLTSVEVIINDVMYQDRKIYCMEIDLGVTQVYKDQDLIEFTVDEEVNKLVEEVPINETNIILNNMTDLFNPLNPTGIVPFLSENTLIKPYIGVLTETLGIEYVKMGEFYFDSYTNNSDSTTTLVGKNVIKQLEQETLKDDNETVIFKNLFTQQNFENYIQNYKYDWNIGYYHTIWLTMYFDKENFIDLLKEISILNTTLLYADRNNVMNMREINADIKDSLTKSELIENVQYKSIDKFNTLNFNRTVLTSGTVESREVYRTTIQMKKPTEYVLCKSSSANIFYPTVTQTGGTSASIVTSGAFMCFVKVTGEVGDEVTIVLSSTSDYKSGKQLLTKTNKKGNEKDSIISIETGLFRVVDEFRTLEYTPSYEMSFDYNGDPSLEAGDYINVETPYGYKKLFIQKNRFKFDGGLEGSIEGVE